MKTPILTLTTTLMSLALLPAAHAERCNVKKAVENAIEKKLARNHLALDSLGKITPQRDGTYTVEFTYVGPDYMDSGFAALVIDDRTCEAKIVP